jgi:NTP pyrophosphatase (non-canonical NTP hydrolase)
MNKYKAILDRFGWMAQLDKLSEEAGELREAIYGLQAGNDSKGHVAEELADVIILANQLMLDDDFKYTVKEEIEYKLNRTLERIRTGYYE